MEREEKIKILNQVNNVLKSNGFRKDKLVDECNFKWSYEPIKSEYRMNVQMQFKNELLLLRISFSIMELEMPSTVELFNFDFGEKYAITEFDLFIKSFLQSKFGLTLEQQLREEHEKLISSIEQLEEIKNKYYNEKNLRKRIKLIDIVSFSLCELFKVWYWRDKEENEIKLEFGEDYSKRRKQTSLCIDLTPQDYDRRQYGFGNVDLMLLNNRVDETKLIEMIDNSTNIQLSNFYETQEEETQENGFTKLRRCINIVVSKE